ncbi:MAG: hypothetical protein H7832_00730 [Magnetococcus sp. DMHC-6]
MKLVSAITLVAVFAVMNPLCAGSLTSLSEESNSGPGTTIQNSRIETSAKTGNIKASDTSTVNASSVDIGRGTKMQNSEIKTESETGDITSSGKSQVNVGSVKIH